MKEIKWHSHARARLLERSIDLRLVHKALEHPDEVRGIGAQKIIHKRYVDSQSNKEYLLRIFLEDRHGEWTILSVYRTSKIGKYWREKR